VDYAITRLLCKTDFLPPILTYLCFNEETGLCEIIFRKMKKTVVIGASDNPDRYANIATRMLKDHGHEVVAVGLKDCMIGDTKVTKELAPVSNVDTVTLYVGPRHQPYWYSYILSLKPRRIIFNPGTENSAFEMMARDEGIEVVSACTLVMLSVGNY
jgi:hypothetical protein